MKKYDMKAIMRGAWRIRRTHNVSMSVALKTSWSVYKAAAAAEKAGKESGWNYKVSINDWAKYGKVRTYISARIYTNAWNLKREIKMGYVDNLTGEFVAA